MWRRQGHGHQVSASVTGRRVWSGVVTPGGGTRPVTPAANQRPSVPALVTPPPNGRTCVPAPLLTLLTNGSTAGHSGQSAPGLGAKHIHSTLHLMQRFNDMVE